MLRSCHFLKNVFVNIITFGAIFFCSSVFARAPNHARIELKTQTRTFNHLNDYALQDGEIWFRPRNNQSVQWQNIKFDADNNETPVSIQADGANLMILDSNNAIHYKKVIKEWRDKEGVYFIEDLNTADNWIKDWFSLPVVSALYKSGRLTLPHSLALWANSHRGEYNAYFEDMRGVKHPEFSSTTTVFALAPDGQKIIFADPYVPCVFGNLSFDGPMVNDGFVIEQLAASASAVFVFGNLHGKKKMFTRYADFDLLRLNPILPGYYFPSSSVVQQWEEVKPPILSNYTNIKGPITIFQTGKGNASRELRIGGYNKQGEFGFYYKSITDSEWKFTVQPGF